MEKSQQKKRIFLSHKKSSALVVSIAIHAVFILVALSFVAVSVVKKNEVDFASKEVKRPKMNLRKLQLPVKVKKASQQPKLRQQIIAKPNVNKLTPDIKMPEIIGVKGGLGSGAGGFGAGNSIGFSMPEINFFGIKGKSEKIAIILNASGRDMNSDALGGAYGYEVIKKECLRLIDGLPSTAVFNILVYDGDKTQQLFPDLQSAATDNKQKAKDWLMPLNAVKGTKTTYGISTLGSGGSAVGNDWPFGKFKEDVFYPKYWTIPAFQAVKQQADTVFLLTSSWGVYLYFLDDQKAFRKKWDQTPEGRKWAEMVAKAQKLLDEDNKRRKAAGEPPRAVKRSNELEVMDAYFPDYPHPARVERAELLERDFAQALKEADKAYSQSAPKLGVQKRSKSNFHLNVVFFKQEKFDTEKEKHYSDLSETGFKALVNSFDGELSIVAGLEAIKSYVDPSSL